MALTPRRLSQSSLEYTSADDIDFDNDLIPIGSAANSGALAKVRGNLFLHGLSLYSGLVSVRAYGAVPNTGEDMSSQIQDAIDSGNDLVFPAGEYYANNLTQTENYQKFHGYGDVRIIKNANGTLFESTGTGVEVHGIKFYGDASTPTYTGDNATFSGDNCTLFLCGSQWAYGRAVKATGNHFQIIGSGGIFQTATAAGYDIELGVSGTATLYHELHGVYSSQASGGILMTDTGATTIVGGQFGKLTIASGTSPAGVNGGKVIGSRILGNVSVGLASAGFTGNEFGAITLTILAGGAGTTLDLSNKFANGATVVSAANTSTLIQRQTGDGSTYNVSNILYGPDSGAGLTDYRVIHGSGEPNANVTASPGSIYFDAAAASSSNPSLWEKASGFATNTGWIPLRGLYGVSTALNPGNQVAGTSTIIATITVAGAAYGNHVQPSFSLDLQGMLLTGYVSAADTVKVVLTNLTGGDINLGSGDLRVRVYS